MAITYCSQTPSVKGPERIRTAVEGFADLSHRELTQRTAPRSDFHGNACDQICDHGILAAVRLAALILIFCAVGCVFMPSEITARKFQVVRVIDGDTFSVLYDGEETSVRIANYDAPEPNQPGGAEATAKLAALIAGKRVRL